MKVQVPGIGDIIEADIAALRAIAGAIGEIPDVDLATIADELSRALAKLEIHPRIARHLAAAIR